MEEQGWKGVERRQEYFKKLMNVEIQGEMIGMHGYERVWWKGIRTR